MPNIALHSCVLKQNTAPVIDNLLMFQTSSEFDLCDMIWSGMVWYGMVCVIKNQVKSVECVIKNQVKNLPGILK